MSPATPEDLFAKLAELGIETSTVTHPPAFTVEEGEQYIGHLPGAHIKNLFLCDAKKKMWLLVAPWDRKIALRSLPDKIGGARMSFGSPDRLMRFLGVSPGSVTPFAVINDPNAHVQILLDAGMMKSELINAHPLLNTMTTGIRAEDLKRFLVACGHQPRIVDFS